MNAETVVKRLQELAAPEQAKIMQRYFKTGSGEYGEGDVFLGLKVPQCRRLIPEFRPLPLVERLQLLQSPLHEARFLGLLLLVDGFQRGTPELREEIYRGYCANTSRINNWDLVDCSAEHVVGAHLRERSRAPLHEFVQSKLIWERRIAIMASFHYIKRGEFGETLRLAETLLHDREDLIHKAVGWMLREIGKRDRSTEESFLRQHYRSMPRTMLRYAIERFPEPLRQGYLKGNL
ncbi:DNA alkylation repair protein [Geomesophilobacter sediminis]|uniref:DNA alkylation repair protein n=1 Tax=Geomesophilobacter sediminis TaxID=2798584 RepID=A0A8J7LU89_9BACT|nr:DNA alkylation repair protein [Geomesophilobacter sediminis]MBJ6723505.1 DNA alkylation repair protein [Geomesophilobacter sediminis]